MTALGEKRPPGNWGGRRRREPFDLARGPLFRITLLRLGDADHVLLVTLHHIITDGWSTGIFMHEVAVLYDAFSRGNPSPLPELAIQYGDFAALAAPVAPGSRAGRAPGLLEAPAGRRSTTARAAHRPSAPGRADVPGSDPGVRASGEPGRVAVHAGRAGRGHTVHDAAGGLPGAPVPVHGRGGHRGRGRDRQSHSAGDRNADRLLRQHAGAAYGPVGQSQLPPARAPGARGLPGGLRPSGPALREARGDAPAGAEPRATCRWPRSGSSCRPPPSRR